ncbi:hypothetical protein QAD02_022364 [Eretmocerus hayati]|uniref:Uncharacterized protein n=1 Tax=Eretmocerus hayati TaxID=131215 RepID=A0ACC2PT25_9HYME|nr:hypothetical protein QAD02_022364 [Eretmocerus hayati]
MKFSLGLCLVLGLAVASLASPAPEIDFGENDVPTTTEISSEQPEEYYAIEERETRNGVTLPVLDQIFQFFLEVLQRTFGMMPQVLNSGVINQLVNMAGSAETPSGTGNPEFSFSSSFSDSGEDYEPSATLEPSLETLQDDFENEWREMRTGAVNPVLQQVFDFYLQVLQKTFGMLPEVLSSGIVKQLVDMSTPNRGPQTEVLPPEPTEESSEKIPEKGTCLPVEVPQSYRKGKPTKAYNIYKSHHSVKLPKAKPVRAYARGTYERACKDFYRKINQEKNQLRKGLLENFCQRVNGGNKY